LRVTSRGLGDVYKRQFIVRPILVPAFTVLIWKRLEGAESAKIHRLRYREKLRKAI
jgi:hypothetical protein